ncbi:MAG: hypothetical protein GTO13_15600 [Proteobacteria bacterium]|nr:hypothetical protein [Pseudomonadota bacterium]
MEDVIARKDLEETFSREALQQKSIMGTDRLSDSRGAGRVAFTPREREF